MISPELFNTVLKQANPPASETVSPPESPPKPLGLGDALQNIPDTQTPLAALGAQQPPKKFVIPSQGDLGSDLQVRLSYSPDASYDQALGAHNLYRQMFGSDLWNQLEGLPGQARTQTLDTMAQASADRASGAPTSAQQMFDRAKSDYMNAQNAAPKVGTMPPDQLAQFAQEMYPNLPEKSQLSPQDFLSKVLFSAAVGGQNFGTTLASMLQLDQAQRDAQDKYNLLQLAQDAGRAKLEHDGAQAGIDAENQNAINDYNARVGAARTGFEGAADDLRGSQFEESRQDKLSLDQENRTQFWESQFQNAKNPGSVLYAAHQLNKNVAVDGTGNLIQKGTDPDVWQNYQQAQLGLRKQSNEEMQQDVGNYAHQMTQEIQSFGSLQNPQQWETKYRNLQAQYPGQFIPAPVGGPSLAKQRFTQAQDEFKKDFGLKSSAAIDSHLTTVANLENQATKLQMAMNGASSYGQAGGIGRNRVLTERQIAMGTAQVHASGYDAQAKQYQGDLDGLQKQHDNLTNQLKAQPDNARDLRTELGRLMTSMKDLQVKVSTAKANSASSKAQHDSMIQNWGQDGSQGVPGSVQENEIPNYLREGYTTSMQNILNAAANNTGAGGGTTPVNPLSGPIGGGARITKLPQITGQGVTRRGTHYRING